MSTPAKSPFWAVIAHRGAPLHYPENSLAGFKAALNLAMLTPDVRVFLETDVQLTADGVPVVHHDTSLRRMFGLPEPMAHYRFDYLRSRPIGSGRSNVHGPIDFAAMQTDAPLHAITDDDYRIPTMAELLELVHATNQYRAQHGTPVGLCMDLKSRTVFTALKQTLEDFYARTPEASVPKVTLGLGAFVKPHELQQMQDSLPSEIRRNFHPDPQTPHYPVQLLSLEETGYINLLSTAGFAQGANQFSRWMIAGDVDPHPVDVFPREGDVLRGSFPAAATRPAVRSAMRRQNLIFADHLPAALSEVSAAQKDPAHLDRPKTHAAQIDMGPGETMARGRR